MPRRRSRLAFWRSASALSLIAGIWIGRMAFVIPDDLRFVLDLALAAATALVLAIWYRGWAREALVRRHRDDAER